MHPLSGRCLFLLATAFALPAAAFADDPAPRRAAQAAEQAAPRAESAPRPAALTRPDEAIFGAAADDAALERSRGGTDVTTISTRLTGTVSGNSATDVITGANVIQGGSFANMSGIPIVVQNSGANVLIQNATTINLQFK
ncbi:MAG TPA: hypothetical protein VFS02_03995 [Telluria sp.]|nr:hypothetical protein [Telluria sp.]